MSTTRDPAAIATVSLLCVAIDKGAWEGDEKNKGVETTGVCYFQDADWEFCVKINLTIALGAEKIAFLLLSTNLRVLRDWGRTNAENMKNPLMVRFLL